MIEGILGKKIGMTQIFSDGEQVPVTVIQAGACYVTQKKTTSTDGYDAIQIGFGEKKAERTNKAMKGHFDKAGTKAFYHTKEFGGEELDAYEKGQEINCADVFNAGDYVDVSADTKGKGFAGVMKRWNFAGGPGGHGSNHHRAPGSIGQSSDPSKVFKGMKMAGQMGNKKTTTQNLKVVDIKKEDNIILIKGAVPGHVNSIIVIKKALKKTSKAK